MNDAENDKCEKWSIVLKETNETIGNISVNTVVKKHNYCEVGYVIRYDYWGNGYASEALKTVTDYLLDNGYYLVECKCNEYTSPYFSLIIPKRSPSLELFIILNIL